VRRASSGRRPSTFFSLLPLFPPVSLVLQTAVKTTAGAVSQWCPSVCNESYLFYLFRYLDVILF
jgi:hypothetical protein